MCDDRYILEGKSFVDTKTNQCLNFGIKDLARVTITLNNMDMWLNQAEERIAELEEQLANSIRPKFKTYQLIFYITQYYTSTKGNPEYDIVSDKYYVAENENEIILGWNYAKDFNQRKYYYVRKDWVFVTKDEALKKLKELGESDVKD